MKPPLRPDKRHLSQICFYEYMHMY
jgi:hypothetical protein